MDNNEIQSFIDNYRDALGRQRDLDFQAIDNERRNAFQNIMSSANTSGMMYSNFPERSKIQYDTNVYMPNQIKAQNTYQTGLDALRNNVTNTYNSIKDLQDAAKALNDSVDPIANAAINDANDYVFWDSATGTTQFRNKDKDKIRFGTAAQRAGYSTPEDILKYASLTLRGQDEYNRLNSIWKKAQENGKTGFIYNTGDSFLMPSNTFLSDAENDFLGSLGLDFQ